MNHSEYIALGRNLATKHKLIRHEEGNEEAFHFARIVLSSDPIGGDNIEEFIESIRNKIKFPFLLWQAYDHSYIERGDNILKAYQGAFIVLMNPEEGNFSAIESAYDQAEEIGEDLLSKIKEDFSKSLKDRFTFLSDSEGQKIAPLADGFLGIRFSFSFQKTANKNFLFNPEKWLL